MNHARFLAIFLPAALILPLAALFVPTGMVVNYVNWLEALALFAGAFLAYRVAASYRKEIRLAFVFMALYLFIFGLAVVIMPLVREPLGTAFLDTVVNVQIVNYAMLVLSCFFIVRVVNVRKLNRTGWMLFAVTLVVCFSAALYPPLSQPVPFSSFNEVIEIAIRLVDAALVTALVPVIWLYVQYLRTQQQQSLTFTIIVTGIVFSTIFDFVFQSLVTAFPDLVLPETMLYYLIPEMIYLYGFSIIAIGLYAHLKHDEWGFRAIERALAQ